MFLILCIKSLIFLICYLQENVQCDFELVTSSPAPLVSLIDKPPEQNIVRGREVDDRDKRGLLWLLDEEAIFPGSNDVSFMERLFLHHGSTSERRKCSLEN